MLVRSALTAMLVAMAACFSPEIADCAFRCGAGGSCPGVLECGSDGFCHAGPGMSCTPGGTGDAPAMDGTSPPPDAPLTGDGPDEDGSLPADGSLLEDGPPPDGSTPDAAAPCTGIIVTTADDFTDNEAQILDTRVDIAASGQVHVSFVSRTTQDGVMVRHARRSPQTTDWVVEDIDSASDYLIGQAIDRQGIVHVSYTGQGGGLWYARRQPVLGWSSVGVVDVAVFNSTLLLDLNGGVHIAFKHGLDLRHAFRPAGSTTFVLRDIHPGITAAVQSAMALLPSGGIAVAYRAGNPTDPDLWFAAFSGGGWNRRELAATGHIANYPAMVITEAGAIHVIHGNYSTTHLDHVLMTGADALHRTADDSPGVGRYNSMALDARGRLHMAYLDYTRNELKYAVLDPISLAGTRRPIEMVGAIQGRSAIAIDAEGAAVVSFPNALSGHVRVARICPE